MDAAGVIAPNTNNDGGHRTARGLAIAQLIIGILSFIAGVITISLATEGVTIGEGIWGGIWIGITGVLGLVSSLTNCNNGCCLAGTYMAFSIVSTVAAFINITILSIDIAISSNCRWHSGSYWRCGNAGRLGFYIPLLLLMLTEFFTSIFAAVYSCKSGTCCCAKQEQSYQLFTNSQQGQATNYPPASYPPASYPPASYPTTNYQPQYAGYPQHVQVIDTPGQYNQAEMNPGQLAPIPNTDAGAIYVSSKGQPIAAHTNIVYSGQSTAPIPNATPSPYNQFSEEKKDT